MINEIFGLLIEAPVLAPIDPFIGGAIISTIGGIISAFATERPKEPRNYEGEILAAHVERLKQARLNRAFAVNATAAITGLPKERLEYPKGSKVSESRITGRDQGRAEGNRIYTTPDPSLDTEKFGSLAVGDRLENKKNKGVFSIVFRNKDSYTVEAENGEQGTYNIHELASRFNPTNPISSVSSTRREHVEDETTNHVVNEIKNRVASKARERRQLTPKANVKPEVFSLNKEEEEKEEVVGNPFNQARTMKRRS